MSTTTAERIKHTRQVVRSDLRDFVRGVVKKPDVGLDQRQRDALQTLRRDGFVTIEGYWDHDRALAMKATLESHLEIGESKDFDCGAYMRFWDDRAYDQGVRRIYHVDRLESELGEFRHDPFILEIIHAYYRRPFHSGALVYQFNTQSNEATRYYHVDAFSREFKAFLYLDDVDDPQGPFTYLRGTHRSHLTRIRKQIQGNDEGSPTSFYDDDLGSKLDREVKLVGPAGTLILADVRGFHRGSPQLGDSRSALVNYFVSEPGDLALDR